jgi:hypothetical protein
MQEFQPCGMDGHALIVSDGCPRHLSSRVANQDNITDINSK